MERLIRTPDQIDLMRLAGSAVAATLATMRDAASAGVYDTLELDRLAEATLTAHGATSAFKGYTPPFHKDAYPFATCISVNNEIVHGLPSAMKILCPGDIVTFDVGAGVDGWHADAAITVGIGTVSPTAHNLMLATERALKVALAQAKSGNCLGDIGYAISSFAKKHRCYVADNLNGHFIGNQIHEAPEVPNFGQRGKGMKLLPGMTLCIEPMFALGTSRVFVRDDGYWTIASADGSLAAHFEHTILITESGCEILTVV